MVEEQRPVELVAHGVADVPDVENACVVVKGKVSSSTTNGVHCAQTGGKAVGGCGRDAHITKYKDMNVGRCDCSNIRRRAHDVDQRHAVGAAEDIFELAAGSEAVKGGTELPSRLKPSLFLRDSATHVIDAVRDVSVGKQREIFVLALRAAGGSHQDVLASSVARGCPREDKSVGGIAKYRKAGEERLVGIREINGGRLREDALARCVGYDDGRVPAIIQ